MLTADRFVRSGKVRDLYDLPEGRLLMVASDRISAFDVVLPTEIPDKGRVLTGLSRFWFAQTDHIVPNHLLDVDVRVIKDAWEAAIEGTDLRPTRPLEVADFASWRGRVMICQLADVVPFEAVVRVTVEVSGMLLIPGSRTVAARARAIVGVPATPSPTGSPPPGSPSAIPASMPRS